jgi:hypothetical protein
MFAFDATADISGQAAQVSFGSKAEILTMSNAFPLFPAKAGIV